MAEKIPQEKPPKSKGVREEKREVKEPKKEKVAFIEVSEAVEQEARDIAEAKLTAEREELRGVRGFVARIWKHNLFYEYYRQKEISKTRQEILRAQNIYIEESSDIAHHNRAMEAIAQRFISEYEETVHTEAGEEREILGEGEKEKAIRDAVRNLVLRYARGELDELSFNNEKNRIFVELRGLRPEMLSKGLVYADNLRAIAQRIKEAIEHGQKIEEFNLDFDVIVGKAKAGVRTEAQFNTVDRLVDKVTKTKIGRFLNEATIASALAIGYSLMGKFAPATVRVGSGFLGFGMFGITGAVGGAVAGLRESKRIEEERRQHFREMAKGKVFEPEKAPRRREMEEFRYEAKNAASLIEELESALYEEKDGKRRVRDLSPEEFQDALQKLADIEARIQLSNRLKIDLISFSDPRQIEQERLNLDLLRAQAKIDLRKIQEKLPLPKGNDFNAYLSSLVETQANYLTKEEFDKRNELFRKMKKRRVAGAVLKGFATGAAIGLVAQEITAFFSEGKQGLLESLIRKGEEKPEMYHFTTLEYLKRWITGDLPRMDLTEVHQATIGRNFIDLPKGVDLIQQPDGSYNLVKNGDVISDNLIFNPDGSIPQETSKILEGQNIKVTSLTDCIENTTSKEASQALQDFIQQNPEKFTKVSRNLWYDNNTQMYRGPDGKWYGADLNELRLWWGGEGNTGLNETGNFVFTVKEMTPEGSFHEQFTADPLQLIKEGKLKILLSMSKDIQGHVFEIPINENGDAIIPKDSEIARALFTVDENGRAKFLGKFAEVAEITGEKEGIKQVNLLATHIGEGIKSVTVPITERIQEEIFKTTFDLPADYGVDLPPVIPIFGRRPLEPAFLAERAPLVGYPYYGGPEFGLLDRKEYKKRIDKELIRNPELDLSGNDLGIIKRYLEKQNRQYLNELEEMVRQLEPMDKKIEAVITIPAYREGKNLKKTLEKYAKMRNPEKFEIMVLENHPKNQERDETKEVVETFKAAHPEMKIRLLYKVFDKRPAIGQVRKYLVDSVLLRKKQAEVERSLPIISHDADLEDISENYVEDIIRAFRNNPRLDAVAGKWDYPMESFRQMPVFYATQRLWHYFDIVFRYNYLKSPELIGRNSAFRSGIYAAIGGYNPQAQLAEDLEIGWLIKEARKYKPARIQYLNRAWLKSSPRRAVVKMISGGRLIQQYGDFHVNEEVRRASLEELLREKRDFDENRFRQEVQVIYDHYGRWRRSKKGWIEDEYFERSFRRAMDFLGVKYEVVDDRVIITDLSKLKERLKKK